MKTLLFFIFLNVCFLGFFPLQGSAQKEGDNWTFMDSIGIKFQPGIDNITFYRTNLSDYLDSNVDSECQATISNNNGNLKYYFETNYWYNAPEWYSDKSKAGIIYNVNHQSITNGDSIYCNTSAPDGSIFLTNPQNENYTVLFTLSFAEVSPDNFAYYLVYHSINNTTETVEIKNKIIYQSIELDEKLSAVRHANGKDWWIFVYDSNSSCFVRFLLDEQGLSSPSFQTINEMIQNVNNNGPVMTFSPQGDKLAFLTFSGQSGLLYFDKCTGTFTLWKKISNINFPTYSCAFSPNGQILYVSQPPSCLFQYNLLDTNIENTKKNIYFNSNNGIEQLGQLKLAPDNRIYFTITCDGCDTVQHRNHLYLHAIDYPDRWGEACGVHIKKHYLGGQKSGSGLPNIPNYRLPALPFAVTGPDRAICKGQTVLIGAPEQSCQTYSWAPAQTLDDPAAAQPTAAPFATTTYTLTTTYEGQTDVQTVTVYVGQYPAEIHATQTPSGAPPFTVTFDFDPVLPGFDFVWLFHDDTKDSADVATKNYSAPGVYPVKLLTRALNGNCVDTMFYSLNVDITGIKEDQKDGCAVNLYPNPAKDELQLNASLSVGKDLTLVVYSVEGKKIEENVYQSGVYRLDLSRYTPGVYIFKFAYEGENFTRKIVVVK